MVRNPRGKETGIQKRWETSSDIQSIKSNLYSVQKELKVYVRRTEKKKSKGDLLGRKEPRGKRDPSEIKLKADKREKLLSGGIRVCPLDER